MSGSSGPSGSLAAGLPPSQAQSASTQTVTVPGYAGTLVPTEAARLRKLRRHLVEAMRGEREIKHPARSAAAASPEPAGFAGEVARAACELCQGWCCSKGGEHAYLDERTLARVRRARPELDAWGVLRLYSQAVAAPAYAGSCVFHGAQGCTLDRSLRSDLCNRYFCNGLTAFLKHASVPHGVELIAGKSGDPLRTRWLTKADRL